jgi:hypothetical protein
VIDCTERVVVGLEGARRDHAGVYRPVQQALLDQTFDLTEEPSSVRAARALATFCGLPDPGGALQLPPMMEVAHG